MTQAYRKLTVHGHPSADRDGHVLEHILIAERALGKYLPDKAMIHHVDENGLNNANRNLVICQDQAYHKLLHVRMRVLRAGGNPNTERVCSTCKAIKPFAAFNRMSASKNDGLQSRCRDCQREYWKTYKPPSKAEAA